MYLFWELPPWGFKLSTWASYTWTIKIFMQQSKLSWKWSQCNTNLANTFYEPVHWFKFGETKSSPVINYGALSSKMFEKTKDLQKFAQSIPLISIMFESPQNVTIKNSNLVTLRQVLHHNGLNIVFMHVLVPFITAPEMPCPLTISSFTCRQTPCQINQSAKLSFGC